MNQLECTRETIFNRNTWFSSILFRPAPAPFCPRQSHLAPFFSSHSFSAFLSCDKFIRSNTLSETPFSHCEVYLLSATLRSALLLSPNERRRAGSPEWRARTWWARGCCTARWTGNDMRRTRSGRDRRIWKDTKKLIINKCRVLACQRVLGDVVSQSIDSPRRHCLALRHDGANVHRKSDLIQLGRCAPNRNFIFVCCRKFETVLSLILI